MRRVVGLALVCVSLIGGACGSDEPARATDVVLHVEPSVVSLHLQVDDHAEGELELRGEGAYEGASARLEIDGTKAPNSAGVYGHHDSYEAVYDGEAVYFAVAPDDRWLRVDLESGSSFTGRDISRLRDLVLLDPTLLAGLIDGAGPLSASGSEEIAGEKFWRFPVTPGPDDPTMRVLDELFGIAEAPMTVVADEDGVVRSIRVEMTYERVRGTSATTTIEAMLTFEPNGDVSPIELPPGSDVEVLGKD